MSNAHFAATPNISIPRSRFNQKFQHKTSFEFSKLVPIDCFEVIAGDSFSCDLTSFIRMSTPIVPIMDNIKVKIHAFFVPMRLVWEHTEEFFGANKLTAGPQLTTYNIPTARLNQYVLGAKSISHYLGKPACYDANYATYPINVSVLKERAYYLIWNEWYRPEQIIDPFVVYTNDTGQIAKDTNNTYYTFQSDVLSVCKEFDYFTAATRSPQFGGSVTLPLGTYAPVTLSRVSGQGDFSSNGTLNVGDPVSLASVIGGDHANLGASGSSLYFNPSSLTGLADLSNATAATINTIRYAFQLQKYLERSNFGGGRYFSILSIHYGVTSPDSRLQRPEYLGSTEFYINIDQVVSTADYSAGTSQKVGQTGAVSVTVDRKNLFNKAFVEPGYVMVLLETKQDHTYSQGVLREDLKTDRFEFYSPEFANLGDQEIKGAEIYAKDPANANTPFGYQEHWAEYRYRPNLVSGLLDPNLSSSLDYWTLADKFANRPILDASFILENRDNISRCLATGSTGPDFIGDFYFNYTATREMPVYTIPGLIDHFGAM